MTSLVLSAVVMLSSSGFLSEKAPAPGLLLGATDFSTAPVESMALTELVAERARLIEARPGLGLGLALTISGGGVFLVGFAVFLVASIIVGAIIMGAAVPLLIIGPLLIANAGKARRPIDLRVRAIDARIGAIKRGDAISPPEVDEGGAPLPPPRPPDVWLLPVVEPQVLVATF